jgi:tRNA(Ile)-lysidine synthetase-like protein
MPRLVREGKPSRSGRSSSGQGSGILSVDIAAFRTLPVALHRLLLQKLAGKMGAALDFKHIQELTHLVKAKSANKRLLLPAGLVATRTFRELQFSHGSTQEEPAGYACALRIPGEVAIFMLGSIIRARLINREKQGISEYNPALLLDRALLERELIVRNWRAGDRYFPAHTQSPKKVKELLQAARLGRPISPLERRCWPVVVSAGQIVWMRGFPVPEAFAPRGGDAVLIEEIQTNSGAEQ